MPVHSVRLTMEAHSSQGASWTASKILAGVVMLVKMLAGLLSPMLLCSEEAAVASQRLCMPIPEANYRSAFLHLLMLVSWGGGGGGGGVAHTGWPLAPQDSPNSVSARPPDPDSRTSCSSASDAVPPFPLVVPFAFACSQRP